MIIQQQAEQMNRNITNPKERIGPTGLKRISWTPNFKYAEPRDWGLAIPTNIPQEEIPCELLEIWSRFFNIGFIHNYGAECVLMSKILRRILRLHGFEAYTRQVVFMFENDERGWRVQNGGEHQIVEEGTIDVHMVVVCNGWILDFAQQHMQKRFGMLAPIGFIGPDDPDTYFGNMIDYGEVGNATWIPKRPLNDHVRHIVYNNKQEEMGASQEYFHYYAMRPYISQDPNI